MSQPLVRVVHMGWDHVKNNEIRYLMYHESVFVIYGFLGRNERREFPACVVRGIRSLCPSAPETYVGFVPADP